MHVYACVYIYIYVCVRVYIYIYTCKKENFITYMNNTQIHIYKKNTKHPIILQYLVPIVVLQVARGRSA